MDVTKLDAAKRQLATAIWLYFEDRDRISVHTLAMAAAEVIDRLCDANGTPGMRKAFMASIVPGRQKEAADALNAAFNFFKHASSAKPNQVLRDFDDDRNIIPLMFATDGVRRLGITIPEAVSFTAWLHVVEPDLFLTPLPREQIAAVFGDIEMQPRAEQKKHGRDAVSLATTGKLPKAT